LTGSWRAARNAGSNPLTVLSTIASNNAIPTTPKSVRKTSKPLFVTDCVTRSTAPPVAHPPQPHRDKNPHQASREPDDRGFGDEDQQHVARACTQRLQHTDLLRPFEHRRVHRVGAGKAGPEQWG